MGGRRKTPRIFYADLWTANSVNSGLPQAREAYIKATKVIVK